MTIALHGFLGLPSDWKMLPEHHAVDLWSAEPTSFQAWAQTFNQNHSGTLVGYSMGGRLALHALIASPAQWKRAVIVSAHPGLDVEKRETRLHNDTDWAEKFVTEPWADLMRLWNGRDIFTHDSFIERKEENFNRPYLAKALKVWSLGQQEKLHDSIAKLPMPITWIVGEKDARFVAEARSLRFTHPESEVLIVPNKGHRIPFDLVAKISFG